jgi:hypothetical protein
VGTSVIIMVDPITKQSAQMPLIQGYEEVQALIEFVRTTRLVSIGSEDEHSPSESAREIRLGARYEFQDRDSLGYP